MDTQRDIRDYELLASVRRRRGQALEEKLRAARAEHAHCVARQSGCEAAWQASLRLRDDYAAQIGHRTAAGRPVRLEELEQARGHGLALHGASDEALKACRQAGEAVATAEQNCSAVGRELAVNQARIASLADQVGRWKRIGASEAEDREEDERSGAGKVTS